MNEKATKFELAIQEMNIPWFTKVEQMDPYNTVLFRSELAVQDMRLPVFVVLDNTIFTVIRLVVANGKVRTKRRAAMDNFLGDLNSRFKVFKYYVSDEDEAIYCDISIPVNAENFDPKLPMYLIGELLLPHIDEYYKPIMALM